MLKKKKTHSRLQAVDASSSVYPLWIGTWSSGGHGFGFQDVSESLAVLEEAISLGFTHFDTAPLYARGQSEILLGRALAKADRSKLYLCTKGGLYWQGNRVSYDGSYSHLRASLEQSLLRLNTDYVDLFLLHYPDPHLGLTDSLEALIQLQKDGLTRFWGVSNVASKDIKKYASYFRYTPHQVHFNPLKRLHQPLLKDSHEQQQMLNCIYSPFEQGLLADKKIITRRLGKKDVRLRNPYFKQLSRYKATLEGFYEACEQLNLAPVWLVLYWLLQYDYVDAVICGPRRRDQLKVLVDFLREKPFHNRCDMTQVMLLDNIWRHAV